MKLIDIGFLSFGVIDLVDISLVAMLLYGLYKIVKGSIALNIFMGFLSIYVFWFIVKAFNMRLLSTLLGQFIGVGMLALIIIFQQEFRRFFLILGKNRLIFGNGLDWKRLLPWNWQTIHTGDMNFEEIASACEKLSSSLTGAIIILARSSELKFFAITGVPIEGELSYKLLETIFNKKSPLHDGAVIIAKNRIKAASCILPVSDRDNLPDNFGLRHRAAIGITEQTDAMAIIVSEENGSISVASKGQIHSNLPHEELAHLLYQEYFELKD